MAEDKERPKVATQFELASLELEVIRLATAVRYILHAIDADGLDKAKAGLLKAAAREVDLSLDSILARWRYRKDPELLKQDLAEHFRALKG